MKQNIAHPVTENQKQNRKSKAKKQSVEDCFFYRSRNLCVVVCTVGFRDSRKQKDGKGIGQYTGKQNDGHGHTGQDTKNTQGIRSTVTKCLKFLRDQKILQAVEKSCRHPVDGKRNRHGSKQFAHRFPLTGKGVVGVSGKPFFQRHGNQTGDKTGTFPGHKTGNRVERRQFHAFFQRVLIDQPYTSHACKLFHQLTERGNSCSLFSIVITVDTGVDAAGKHGKAKERKEGSAADLSEKMQGDPVCLCVKKNTDDYRGRAGDDQTEQQISACSYFSLRCPCVFAAGIADKFGNGCLDGGGSQGETHCKNGCDQLIDSECFCTNCLCQEYPIEEADDTAGNTGSRHQKGAGNQRIF